MILTSARPICLAPEPEVMGEHVAAGYLWRDAAGNGQLPETRDLLAAAHAYLTAIDVYVATLKAHGREIPYQLDEVADGLRATCGSPRLHRVA